MLGSKEKCVKKKEGNAGERERETKGVRGVVLFMLFLLYFETGSYSP